MYLCTYMPSCFTFLWPLIVFSTILCVIFLLNLKLSLLVLDPHLILCSKVKKNVLQIINNNKNMFFFDLKSFHFTWSFVIQVLVLCNWKCSLLSLLYRCSCRGSHQRCSVRKGVLRNFTKFTWKHLCQSFTLDFFISNLGFCLELGMLNSETKIGTGVA